jgi:amidase
MKSNDHSEICFTPLSELAKLIESRRLSPVEIVVAMLGRISSVDGRLHSYITIASDLAMEQAEAAELAITRGNYRGPLHGVPIAAKDIYYTRGVKTTCGSKILADFVPNYDATAIARLYNAGAVLLGKLTLTEFAGIGYNPMYAPAVNPWNADSWTGSSSSGSGVATAAGLCYGALGTDTGGSIRFPSAACGLVGIKPTYGAVSRHGVFTLADTLDHAGPMTRTVEDAAIILDAIAGFDPNDPSSLRETLKAGNGLRQGVRGLKVGFDVQFCSEAVDPDVAAGVASAVATLEKLGASIREIDMSGVKDSPAVWGAIFTAECGAAHQELYATHASDYSAPFRAFLESAQKLTGIEYVKASIERQRIRRSIEDRLQEVDLLACPSMALAPMALGGKPVEAVITEEIGNRLLKFTSPFSLSGHPTVSVPCGFTQFGLPLSMQLIGAYRQERLLIRAAYAYEQATEWRRRHPDVDHVL